MHVSSVRNATVAAFGASIADSLTGEETAVPAVSVTAGLAPQDAVMRPKSRANTTTRFKVAVPTSLEWCRCSPLQSSRLT